MNYLVKFTDSKVENIILNICILLFGINFLYKCNYIVMGTFVLLLIFKKFKINFGNLITLITLLLFSISWFIFSDGHEIAGICLPLCYLIGCNIDEHDEKGITKFILLVAISLALYTTLFFINNAVVNGINNYDVYNQPNIWTGRPLWATNIMMYSSLFYGCFGYVLFTNNLNLKFKIIYFIIFAINAFYALMLSRRAALLMVVLSMMTAFIYKLFFNNNEKKHLIKLAIIACLIAIICVAVFVILYSQNILGFKDIVMKTDLYERFLSRDISIFFRDMGRSKIRKKFMKYFFDYPWGGSNIHEIIGNYSHDLWLDVYDVAGIIAMILIIASTLILIVKIINIMKNKNISIGLKTLVISLFICVLAQCCIEPIMEACRAYMFGVCMIHGSLETIEKGKNA